HNSNRNLEVTTLLANYTKLFKILQSFENKERVRRKMNVQDKTEKKRMKMQDVEILNLPDEILLCIFEYVNISSRKNVSQVCWKFYELICIVERDCHPLEISNQQICDAGIRSSIVKSYRKFEHLKIDINYIAVDNIEYILDVMGKFGERLKRFKLWSSNPDQDSEFTTEGLIKILDCLPNVEDLTLTNIHFQSDLNVNHDKSEFNMHKLKKLEINVCSFMFPNILHKIPKNTLRDLIFLPFEFDVSSFQKFFNQQTNIRKLEVFEFQDINFNHLELEHLKIFLTFELPAVLRQQPKLRYLELNENDMDNEIFTVMCDLKNLEVAKMSHGQVSCNIFNSLKKMSNLKELQLWTNRDDDECHHLLEFSMMHSLQIEKLTLLCPERKISEDILIQLSQHFRKLKHIEFLSSRIVNINLIKTILEYFPNLELIVFEFYFHPPEDILIISEDLRHENLKQLEVTNNKTFNVENTRTLLKLISVCPNLERIIISKLTGIVHEDLQQILDDHPKLTHLSLEFDRFTFQHETIELIHSAGSRLKDIRFGGLRKCPSDSALKILFEDEFPNISSRKNLENGMTKFIMKKRNISEWYSDFDFTGFYG
ncbi:CLUMA_CG006069, isoform A, partial [Clunio marinus]